MNIETMRLLVAKGLTAEDMLEVAEAMAVKTDRTAAERQARHRAKVKAEREAVTRDVTRDTVTNDPLSRPPNEINSNPPTHTPDNTTRAREAFPKPDWADSAVWRDFLKNRKAKKATNTETAHKRFLGDIAKHTTADWPPGKLLEYAVGKGWGSIHKPEEVKNGYGRTNGKSGNSTAAAGERAKQLLGIQ